MKIHEILKKCGWIEEKKKNLGYFTYNGGTYFKHPVKNIEYWVQSKEIWKDKKMLVKFSTSKNQSEVVFDEIHKLIIVNGEIAIDVS